VAKSGNATIWQGSGDYQTTAVDTKSLTSVSCTTVVTSELCWAVDHSGNVVSYNGTSWSTQATDIDGSHVLESVSCLTASNNVSDCSAVDNAGNVLTYNGTSWSAAINIDSTKTLVSVSCTSSTVCVAVDTAGKVFTTTDDWASGSIESKKVGSQSESMSCANTTTCQLVNSVGDVRWTTNQWFSSTQLTIDSRTLESVSCWGTTNCSAVDSGGYALTTDNDWTNTSVVKIA
jgi:hypothetical protein